MPKYQRTPSTAPAMLVITTFEVSVSDHQIMATVHAMASRTEPSSNLL
jgi:hypothetical protein